nr:hypothetical protein [Paramyrothecium sp.]
MTISRALKQARLRVAWLEGQIQRNWGIECANLATGTSLESNQVQLNTQASSMRDSAFLRNAQHMSNPGDFETVEDGPDLSLVALNATGDMRYLGPSSGAFFAAFATSIARSFASTEDPGFRHLRRRNTSHSHNADIDDTADEYTTLSSADVQLLLQSYEMWIQPLYPLLHTDKLRRIVEKCQGQQMTSRAEASQNGDQHVNMVIFYLVMALGAINRTNTVEQMRDTGSDHISSGSTSNLSPVALYLKSLYYFDHGNQNLQPNISNIQIILLISIYGSYGPVGSSQWQLAGLAMRMATEIGLHHLPRSPNTRDEQQDERNSVFWTAYSIEISLAYNLGRPPSIGEDYITAALPEARDETAIACHYVEHRRIQSRILSRVYCAKYTVESSTPDQQQTIIAGLQAELDGWKANIPHRRLQAVSAYPQSYWDRLYHGTSFVLHRSSPLCPNPTPQSLENCIRAAGAYLDNMIKILRTSHVPLSWMLVQGVVFAGLTMLITGRRGFQKIVQCAGMAFLLVEFPAWARTCSICLAIINERWKEELISKLETQFEALANDTLRVISLALTSQPPMTSSQLGSRSFANSTTDYTEPAGESVSIRIEEPLLSNDSGWDDFDTFKDVLGFDEMNTLWDMFSTNGLFDEPPQDSTWQT